VLEEIFPISLRGGVGHRGGIPGLPEVPGLFTPNESVRGLWRIVLRGFPETEGKRGLLRCGGCEGGR
jgi:hypothetical protein